MSNKQKKHQRRADVFLVELVENYLHPLTMELERWHGIIGEHYLDYKLEKQRNSLANKPVGYTTI